ncbi:hypothetical protein SAMN04488128_105404 [Chitinophaga eiseniae]|uniref:Uncharacterized protein n=1 Tax=Chitinophaga eiseniae TaxID=634771 RepID=A0A1T4TLB1_9BACT|nr:hypothetical protein SAMN04488128_105404 [Chitinophaga eiseniae]
MVKKYFRQASPQVKAIMWKSSTVNILRCFYTVGDSFRFMPSIT